MRSSWVALGLVLAACEAPPVAPPTALRVEMRGGAAVVSWKRSADDGGGRGVVRGYAVLRGRTADGAFRPFADEPVEQAEAGEGRAAVRDPAPPLGLAHYRVYAIPERESGSPSHAGGTTSFATVRAPAGGAPRHAVRTRPAEDVVARAPQSDDGTHVEIAFRTSPDDGEASKVAKYVILRGRSETGPFVPFAGGEAASGLAAVADDPAASALREEFVTALVGSEPGGSAAGLRARVEAALAGGSAPDLDDAVRRTVTDTVADDGPFFYRVYAVPRVGAAMPSATVGPVSPRAAVFGAGKGAMAILLAATVGLTLLFVRRAETSGKDMFIRRIAGVDAIEEAIGRATEMGRPVLYVPGIDEIQNIQTIASLLVLGRVSELVARYGAQIKVPCCIPLVATVAEEVVRQGFYNAGRPDAHRPQNIQWISSEQFAFCAGTNGIMLREKPATNIYIGRFFAESLILAETGYVNRAIQIGGTAEITQLPFFIAACDYTLIGEEIFAVTAYMTREPKLLGTLKAADWVKAGVVATTLAMAVAALLVWAGAPYPDGNGFASACLEILAFLDSA